jgi:PmbA protein
MERDYDYSSALHAEDLDDPVRIGRSAAERALRRLNPRKLDTAKVPVIFDPRVAGGLISHALGAISGPSIARGTSFLKDKLGQPVFSSKITVREEPHRKRGLRSRPYDAEGLPTQARALFDKGVLTTWLLDLRSARQLNLAPTGHAARGTSGPPGPAASNLTVDAGTLKPQELYAGENALYVTDLMGQGVNGLTGDYSRGAAGFWIENGEIAYPVSEITIAGNLKDMYQTLTPADDLEIKRGLDSPSLRVDGMVLAGR